MKGEMYRAPSEPMLDCFVECDEGRAEGLDGVDDTEEIDFEHDFCYFHVYVEGGREMADRR
jgi:hypothetical protein